MPPIISVIIPVYNGERFIARAINSVLDQSFFELIEICVVDDGSKDGTARIIDSFDARFNNVHAFHKENGGEGSARNFGMQKATGKYFAFLDADDWWEPGVIDKTVIAILEKDDLDVLGFGYRDISFDLRFCTDHCVTPLKKECETNGGIVFQWWPMWTFFYKSKNITEQKMTFFDTKVNADISFAERCFYLSRKVEWIDRILYNYWSNTASIMHTTDRESFFEEHCRSLLLLKEWYSEQGNDSFSVFAPIVSMVAQSLPFLCCYHSTQYVQDYFEHSPYKSYFESYKSYRIDDQLEKRLLNWGKSPKQYWVKTRLFFKPKIVLQKWLWKHNKFHSVFIWFFFGFIVRRKKISSEKRALFMDLANRK